MKPKYREIESIPASEKSVLDSLCDVEESMQLKVALKTLPSDLRQLVERRFCFRDTKQPTIRELAVASGVSHQTIHNRLKKSLNQLKEALTCAI